MSEITILVIEDDPAVRRGIVDVLEVIKHPYQFALSLGDSADQQDDASLDGFVVAICVHLRSHVASHRVVHLGDIRSRFIPQTFVIPSAAERMVPRPQVQLMRSTTCIRASLFLVVKNRSR